MTTTEAALNMAKFLESVSAPAGEEAKRQSTMLRPTLWLHSGAGTHFSVHCPSRLDELLGMVTDGQRLSYE